MNTSSAVIFYLVRLNLEKLTPDYSASHDTTSVFNTVYFFKSNSKLAPNPAINIVNPEINNKNFPKSVPVNRLLNRIKR